MQKLIAITIGLIIILVIFLKRTPSLPDTNVNRENRSNSTTSEHPQLVKTHTKRLHKRLILSPLEKAQNEVDRLGLAQTIEDLYRPLDDVDNAAALLGEIFKLMKDKNSAAHKLADIDFEKLNPAERAKLWHSLQEPDIQKVLALAFEAAQKEGADFKLKYENGPGMVLPQLGIMRRLTKLLSHTTQLKTEFESADEAFNSLKTSFKIAEFSADGLTLIGSLVEQACHQITLKALPSKLNDNNRQELYKLLHNNYINSREKYQKSIDGERVLLGPTFTKLPQMIADNPKLLSDIELPPNHSFEDEQAYHTEVLLNLRELSGQDYYEAKDEIELWEQEIEDRSNQYPITSSILPSLSTALIKSHETQTQTQMAMIRLEIQAYQEKYGADPKSLQDLNLPTHLIQDTFTGDSLIYEKIDGKTKFSSQGKVRDKEIALEF